MTASASLCVSVVSYAPDFAILQQTLESLHGAIDAARSAGVIADTQLILVDNGPGTSWGARLKQLAQDLSSRGLRTGLLTGHGNVGYGRGHNLAIQDSTATYHLVLNPDVVVAPGAIAKAVEFLEAHPDIGMLAPQARGADGALQFLCKRYPAVADLALRGFAPPSLRLLFRRRLEHYEMRDVVGDKTVLDVPTVSGSFMFFRRAPVTAVGGFDPAFFMYFEDFDLSLRLSREHPIAYVPAVKIVHLGGGAARKGTHHIVMFVRSAVNFFDRHGWKWW